MAGDISRENGKKGGRKKGAAAILAEKSREYIAKRVAKEQGPIIDKAIEQARAGDDKARQFLYERGFGKVAQTVDLGNKDGVPFQVGISEVIAKKNNIKV